MPTLTRDFQCASRRNNPRIVELCKVLLQRRSAPKRQVKWVSNLIFIPEKIGAAEVIDMTRKNEPEKQPSVDGENGKEHKPREIGGPKGPEPTRYGDWEKAGRCIDF